MGLDDQTQPRCACPTGNMTPSFFPCTADSNLNHIKNYSRRKLGGSEVSQHVMSFKIYKMSPCLSQNLCGSKSPNPSIKTFEKAYIFATVYNLKAEIVGHNPTNKF